MKEAVDKLAELLRLNKTNVEVYNLLRDDMSEAVAKAFAYEKVILATTTYNNGIFPLMNDFTHRLIEHRFQNKKIGIMEGGTWAPQAGDILKKMFVDLPGIKIDDNIVTVLGSLNSESEEKLEKLAKSFSNII